MAFASSTSACCLLVEAWYVLSYSLLAASCMSSWTSSRSVAICTSPSQILYNPGSASTPRFCSEGPGCRFPFLPPALEHFPFSSVLLLHYRMLACAESLAVTKHWQPPCAGWKVVSECRSNSKTLNTKDKNATANLDILIAAFTTRFCSHARRWILSFPYTCPSTSPAMTLYLSPQPCASMP